MMIYQNIPITKHLIRILKVHRLYCRRVALKWTSEETQRRHPRYDPHKLHILLPLCKPISFSSQNNI